MKMHVAGGKVPDDHVIDGIEMRDFFVGKTDYFGRESVVVYSGNDVFGVKWRNWKMNFKEIETVFGEIKEYGMPKIYSGLLLALLLPLSGYAQLSGLNTKGDFGLLSGTQAPPGFYIVPLYYDYTSDTLRDQNGDSRPALQDGGSVDARAGSVGHLWVSDFEILGGNYGFEIWPGFTNNALEAPLLGADDKVSTGFADLYIRPINLGWNIDRADFIAGIGIYVPTGEYEAGGDHNRGLGMWGYELFGGATVYFDAARTWHFATLASYETYGKKDDTDIRVGDLLTLEGGFGKSFLEGAGNIGIAYYAQWKVSNDDLGLNFSQPAGPLTHQHRVYGFGPEATFPIASKKALYGFLTLRYLWETGARSTLEGNTFVVQLSFPVPSIPLH
jgi:hypothetical protein